MFKIFFNYPSLMLKREIKSSREMPLDDGREDFQKRVVVKLIYGQDLQMPGEPARNVVPSSARRSHCSHEQLHDKNVIVFKIG